MSNAPLFSIVVPAYNVEDYLDECLKSIACQTNHDYEVIVIDDGSTDATGQICEAWCSNNDKWVCIHKKNEGLLLARSDGINLARGLYIVFIDADDTIEQGLLSSLYEAASCYSPDIISFDYYRDPVCKLPVLKHGLPREGFYSGDDYQQVKKAVVGGDFNNLCAKAIKRCVFLADTTDYRSVCPGLMRGEDWIRLIKLVDISHTFYYLQKPLYYYRINDGASTATYKRSQVDEITFVLSTVLPISATWGDNYLLIARGAAIKSYCGLLKSLCLTVNENSVLRVEFKHISNAYRYLGLDSYPHAKLNLNNYLLSLQIKQNRLWAASLLVRLIEFSRRLGSNY